MEYNIAAERAYNTPAQNSTFLHLLLMSLAMTKNAPKPSRKIYERYDYIVVGAGTAGSVVASRLSEIPCVRVLLLEAGKSPPLLTDVLGYSPYFLGSDIDWLYMSVPQKRAGRVFNSVMPLDQGKTLGGSSTINGMQFVRGNKLDYDNWEKMGAKGWSYQDVFQYFIKMENNTDPEFLNNGYHGSGGPLTVETSELQDMVQKYLNDSLLDLGYETTDANGPKQLGTTKLQQTRRNNQRCSASKAYLVPTENRTNIDILTNALVTKVLFTKNRAIGVTFDYQNKSYTVYADREIILSAGAIRTPQLMLLSGIGPRDELQKFDIPMVADLPVGRNFHDHIGAMLLFAVDDGCKCDNQQCNDQNIKQYVRNRSGPLTGGGLGDDLVAFVTNPLNRPSYNDLPDIQFLMTPDDFDTFRDSIDPEIYNRVFRPYENQTIFTCLAINIHPKSRGTVTLQSLNPYDQALIDPNYFAVQQDLDDTVEGMKSCYKIIKNLPTQELDIHVFQNVDPNCEQYLGDIDKLYACNAMYLTFSSLHFVGSAKMGGRHDPTAVVDPKLRVKGVDGLRVVDASVMPKIPSGNTMTPVYMIAEKAADMIKETIHCWTKPYPHAEGQVPFLSKFRKQYRFFGQ